MDRVRFYEKVSDQFCYLFNLWSVEGPSLGGFLLFYEDEISKEAATDAEALMPWRLREPKTIEDEMPKMLVKYMKHKRF
jgi:hypothetical protein